MHDHLIWKSGKREILYKGPIFDVAKVERTSTDGRCAPFIEVAAPKWVTIIPVYRNKEGIPMVVMVDQFRHGSATVTREFPAGVVDEGEMPKEAAARELLEETGLVGSRITLLGEINPNPAFMSNRAYFYLIEDVAPQAKQDLDENEQIDVLSVPLKEVVERMGTGIYDNGIMMIALGFFMREAKRRPDLIGG
ncbi:MAG: NUDIX hydrolase [Spirochaetales bacterium]|jgi:8-oxo-dGTP pyrophosphatase MutT (NUDIX family)|nr:NUDIX hydrolase [Spirochaetales bacterium]